MGTRFTFAELQAMQRLLKATLRPKDALEELDQALSELDQCDIDAAQRLCEHLDEMCRLDAFNLEEALKRIGGKRRFSGDNKPPKTQRLN